jgi:hypothetical protein
MIFPEMKIIGMMYGWVRHITKQPPKKEEAICSFAEFAIPFD